MHIMVNGIQAVTMARTTAELRQTMAPECDGTIVDGYQLISDIPLQEGMTVVFWQRNHMPSAEAFETIRSARDSPAVHSRLRKARVGIAGLGGLGSNLAATLVRAGIGALVLADFDAVDPTNLNRQNYTMNDVGRPKTDATAAHLQDIDPTVQLELHQLRLEASNIPIVFAGCDIVCEAFDREDQKALLVETVLAACPQTEIVASSGLAGWSDANLIQTAHPFSRLTVCGDGISAARPGCGLMAPRVMVCVGHMANAVIQRLMAQKSNMEEQS